MIHRMPELARAVPEALTRANTQPPHLVLAELLALARSAVAADFALILVRTDPYTAEVLASDPPDVIPAGAGRPELIEAALAGGEPFFGLVTSRRIPAYLRGCHAVLPLGAEMAAVIGRRSGVPWDEQERAFLGDLRGALAPTAQWAVALRQRDAHKTLLDAVVDTLDNGVLVVDNAGSSWINGPGARLLGVPAGSVEPAAVAAALAALRSRAANAGQLEQQAAELAIRQEGRIAGSRWVLGGEPRQVIEVASVPIHTAASGRLWLFADVTAEHNARLQLEAHEAALAASEAKYRTTFEQAADGIIRVSEDGRLLEANSRFAAMLGWTPEELAGRQVLDLIAGSAAHLRKEIELQLYFQGRADLEQALRRRDGSVVTTEATVAPLHGGEYLIIVRDVTERRAAEREHAFLSAVVASSSEAIVGRGIDGTILSWNSGAEQIFGYTAAEAIGRHISFFFAPESRKQMARVIADVLMGQTFSAFESRRVTKDGHLIDVLVTTSAVRNAQGQIIGAASIMRDISERKRTEAALRESERKYRDLYDNSPDMYMSGHPADHLIRECNLTLARALGYTREELIGQSNELVFEPASFRHMVTVLPRYIAAGQYANLEVRLQRKDGTTLDALMSGILEPATADRPAYSRVSFHNVTERRRLEELVRASEGRLKALIENTDDTIWSVDRGYGLLVANSAFLRTVAIQIGRPLALGECVFGEHFPPSVRDFWQPLYDRVLAGEAFTLQMASSVRPGGTLECYMYPMRDADGLVTGAVCRTVDITDRLLAEAEVRNAQERFRLVVENSPSIIWAWDGSGQLLYASPAVEKHYGISPALMLQAAAGHYALAAQVDPAELSAQRLVALGAPDLVFADNWLRSVQAVRYCASHPGEKVEQVGSAITMWGDKRYIQSIYQGFALGEGGAEVVSITLDITEQTRAQEQVQRALDQLKLATDAAEIGIWTWDFASDQLVWDDRLSAFYEVPEAMRQAGLYYDFWRSCVHPDDREDAESSLAAARSTGAPWARVFRIILPGNRIRYIQSASITEYDAAGQPLRMIGVNRDVTRERQREEELRAAQRAAEAANKAKTQYLALINHELRTPLNAILGLAQIMQTNPDLQAMIGEDLITMVESGNHMLALINEVLDLAKIEAGKAELVEKYFDLHLLLRTIHAMLQPKLDAKALSFTMDMAPETPRFLRADEGKLRQVLINLLNNAAKFTSIGGVTLAVWSEAPGRLALRVTDTGAGIAPEQIGRLFKPFMQTDSARTQQEGTGLGLAISQSYVRLMGGDITVASTLGEGTSFQFDILCQEASAPGAQAQAQQVIGLAPGTPTHHILIVDDVYTNRRLLRRHLEPLGFELSEAVDGVEALAQWEAQQPDLILLDIMLPRLDGGSVARIIRTREAERAAASADGATERPHTIIVAATASVLHHELVELTANGCDAVLTKPFTRQELLDVLHAMLGVEFQYAVAASAAAAAALTPAPGSENDGGALVLVVDDNAVNREVAIAMLKRLGHPADAANNGEEALEALRRRPYTLLLLDLQMPVMGGLEAARRIHQEWGERRPYLLAVTGGTSEEEQEACRQAGMDAWLAKPLQLAELQAVLEQVLPEQTGNHPAT